MVVCKEDLLIQCSVIGLHSYAHNWRGR